MTQLTFDDMPHRARFSDLNPRIVDAFFEYHKANPHVYDLFKRFASDLYAAGRGHFGSKAIIERIRFETAVRGNDEFKINNNFASCYARLLILDMPIFREFFETRRSAGNEVAA